MVSLYSNNDISNQFISLVENANAEIIFAFNAFFDTACLNKIAEKLRNGIKVSLLTHFSEFDEIHPINFRMLSDLGAKMYFWNQLALGDLGLCFLLVDSKILFIIDGQSNNNYNSLWKSGLKIEGEIAVFNEYSSLFNQRKELAIFHSKLIYKEIEVDENDLQIYWHGAYCGFKFISNGNILCSNKYDYAQPFSEGRALVKKNGKFGFIDTSGRESIPFIFAEANSFSDGLSLVKIDNKYGYIDKHRRIIIDFIYDEATSFKHGIAKVKLDGKYLPIDNSGRIIKPIRESVSDGLLIDDIIILKEYDILEISVKYGVVDSKLNELLPFEYDSIEIWKDNWLKVKSNGLIGLFNYKSKALAPAIFQDILEFNDSAIIGQLSYDSFGLYDFNGNEINPKKHKSIKPINKEAAIVADGDYGNETCGLIDTDGIELIKLQKWSFGEFENAVVDLIKCDKIGSTNINETTILNPKYSQLRNSKYGICIVSAGHYPEPRHKDDDMYYLYGIVDHTGKLIVPKTYSFISDFINDISIVRNSSRWHVIDTRGTEILSPIYDSIELFCEDYVLKFNSWSWEPYLSVNSSSKKNSFGTNYANIDFNNISFIVKKDGKCALVNYRGEMLTGLIYEEITAIENNLLKAKLNTGLGLIDCEGGIILPFEFKFIEPFVKGICKTIKDKQLSLFQTANKRHINLPFDDIINLDGVKYKVVLNDKSGLLNKDLTLIVQCIYDSIKYDSSREYLIATKDSKCGCIDFKGKVIIPFDYEDIEFTDSEIFFIAKKDSKYGCVNRQTFEVISPFDFEGISFNGKYGYAHVSGQARSLINATGKVLYPADYVFYNLDRSFQKNEEYLKFRSPGGYGLADLNGNVIVPPVYADVTDFKEGLSRVKYYTHDGEVYNYADHSGNRLFMDGYKYADDFNNGKAALTEIRDSWIVEVHDINKEGKIYENTSIEDNLITIESGEYFIINYLDEYRFNKSLALSYKYQENLALSSNDNLQWGFIDKKRAIVIDFLYESADSFKDGISRVKHNNKFGWIDLFGQTAIPLEYDFALPFSDGLASVCKSNKWGFINLHGDIIIDLKYDYASSFNNNLAAVKLNDIWHYIDKTGNITIPIEFQYASGFLLSIAFVIHDGKYQFINTSGVFLHKHSLEFGPKLEQAYASGYSDKRGFKDENGEIVIPCIYDKVRDFKNGIALVKEYEKWSFIDSSGRQIIPEKYLGASYFSEGLAAVKVKLWGDVKIGFIDQKGNLIIPFIYDNARRFSEGIAAVKLKDKWGFIDMTGKTIIDHQFEDAHNLREGLVAVKKAGLWGFINKSGSIIIQHNYGDVKDFSVGIAPVKLRWNSNFGGRYEWQLIDKNGNTVIISDSAILDQLNSQESDQSNYTEDSGPERYGYNSWEEMNFYEAYDGNAEAYPGD